jgi:hypothetical protein
MAGDLAIKDMGEASLIAGNLIDYLPHSFKKLKEDKFDNIIEWMTI